MYYLVYISSAVNKFSDEELDQVLAISRKNNGAVGITGLLLYVEGNFIQLLEGEKNQVMETHSRIAKDPRHHGLMTLIQGERENRDFVEWSMGFKKVSLADAKEMPGYSDFLASKGTEEKHRSAGLLLLSNFKKNMR